MVRTGPNSRKASIRRSSCTISLKGAAIRHFDLSLNKSKTCRELKIHRSGLAKWLKNREQIMDPQNLNSFRRIQDPDKKKNLFKL